MSPNPFALPTLPDLAQRIRAGLSKLLAQPSYPQDPSLVTVAPTFRFLVTDGGKPVGAAKVLVSIASLGPAGVPILSFELTTGGDGTIAQALTGLTYQLAATYRIAVEVLVANGKGDVFWDEPGYVIRSQGIVGTLDLATGSSSASTGGSTQSSGTGSVVATYGPILITVDGDGQPGVNAAILGSLQVLEPGQPAVTVAGARVSGRTNSAGQISGKWDEATDSQFPYQYVITIDGIWTYKLYFDAGIWKTGLDPNGLKVLLQLTGANSGKITAAKVTATPSYSSVSGPGI